MPSVRENAVQLELPRKTRSAAGFIAPIFAVLAVASAAILGGCAGTSPGPFEDAEDLQAFLKGEAPIPEERAELARLNEAFARQSVRAHGYVREGISDENPDGWSPVVRGADSEPADITPWLEGGDIDPAGRFVPAADLCEASGPASIEGLPEDALRIDGLQDRLTRLSCAIERIAGGEAEIQWTEPSAAAIGVAEPGSGGAALVNPRVLHLILTEGEASHSVDSIKAPGLEPAGAGPDDDNIVILDEGDIDHHPRPDPEPEDEDTDAEDVAECIDTCAKGCDLLVTILAACDSSEATSSGAEGGCETSVPGDEPGSFQAFLFSLALVFSIAIRRRGARRRGSALFLAPLFILFLNGGLARAQAPAKPAAPPPAQAPAKPAAPAPDPAEPAPPAPPKDWKELQKEGMKKLDEKNYGDAIRLLQEAYLLDPTADKLEAIARAQRGAGQTQKAIQTLEHVRAQFGESLTEEKYEAITAEIEKMKGELVTVRIITRPMDATITIDGEELPPGSTATPIQMGPGAHKFGASAEGYAAGYRTVDIVPGRETRDVVLNLPPNKVFLWITAPAPNFGIEIDGKEVGKGEWSGFVEPGKHEVLLKQPEGQTFKLDVDAEAGKAIAFPTREEPLTYPGMPEEPRPSDRDPGTFDFAPAEPPSESVLIETGTYFLANASMLWHTTRLYGFKAPNGVPGFALGARAGYRPYTNISFEMLLEYSYFGRVDNLTQVFNRDQNNDGLVDDQEFFINEDNAAYAIHDVRFGPVLRFMSGGTKHRVIVGLGAGILYESIQLDHADFAWNFSTEDWDNRGTFHHDYGGPGAFLLLEAGYERSIGRLLLGGVFNVFIDNVSSIEEEPYGDSINARLGLALRVGYSAWKLESVIKKKP